MPRDYIPAKDADLLAWSANFANRLSSGPTGYGLVAADATAYAQLHSNYAAAYTQASSPSSRTQSSVAIKDATKAALIRAARTLAQVITVRLATTNAQRSDLGLTLVDGSVTPTPPPPTRPVPSVATIAPGRHTLRIADEFTPSSRAKPYGAAGAEIYVSRGVTAPAGVDACQYVGLATGNTYVVNHAPATAGQTAYYLARWINGRGQRGPVSSVVSGTIAA